MMLRGRKIDEHDAWNLLACTIHGMNWRTQNSSGQIHCGAKMHWVSCSLRREALVMLGRRVNGLRDHVEEEVERLNGWIPAKG